MNGTVPGRKKALQKFEESMKTICLRAYHDSSDSSSRHTKDYERKEMNEPRFIADDSGSVGVEGLDTTPPITITMTKHAGTGQPYTDVKDSAGNAWLTAQTEDGAWEHWRQYLFATEKS
jgi:hypothetical protein